MANRPLIFIIIFLLLQATAAAEIYRCQISGGDVVFTDKRLNLSDDCVLVKEELPPDITSNWSSQTGDTPSAEDGLPNPEASDKTAGKAGFELWVSRASTLVNDYQAAVKNRFHETRVLDKQKAMVEITRIKLEKETLLKELKESSLNRKEREEIQNILAEIPY